MARYVNNKAVYVVEYHYDYSGFEIAAVLPTLELAIEYAEEVPQGDHIHIYEYPIGWTDRDNDVPEEMACWERESIPSVASPVTHNYKRLR